MKKFILSVLLFNFIFGLSYAQDLRPLLPKSVGVNFFLNDFASANRIRSTSLSRVLGDKRWATYSEMNPGLAISYYKGVKPLIDFVGSLGGSILSYPTATRILPGDKLLLEATGMFNFKMFPETYGITPYLTGGVGGHKYGPYYGAFLPLGMGIKANLYNYAHMFLSGTYRVPVTPETANYHFQYNLGVAGVIGKIKQLTPNLIPPAPVVIPDTDGDGIPDDKDKCVTVPGVSRYLGCPIPDTDGDGINDEEDKCPRKKGTAKYNGCPIPDTDGDGINDEEDQCISVPGLARYHGCPIPDTDGDGINDEEDKCPTLAGVKENQGCPVISDEIKKKIAFAAKNIYFETAKYNLLKKSFKNLNNVVDILNTYPDLKLDISGHTDNRGNADKNLLLSDNRSKAVLDYLVSKGINPSRLTAAGYGLTMPIADNKTAVGRQLNRRVELLLKYF